MANITQINNTLPANIQDLTRFVLVGREKLVSVRAEIRAIDKLNIAEEVRQQKRDEAQMLSEALLDAEVKIGELLKAIPKDPGGRPEKTIPTGGTSFEKPKLQVVQDLGFTKTQANRFETLANNPEIVAQVKAEARENDDIPTRSRVLQLVQEKNRKLVDPVDFKFDAAKEIKNALTAASAVEVTPVTLRCFMETVRQSETEFHLTQVNMALENLMAIKSSLTKGGMRK